MTAPPYGRTQPQRPQQRTPQQVQPKQQTQQAPTQQMPPVAGAGDQAPVIVDNGALPGPVSRRGITEAQWRTLKNNLYPGATNDSCLMVWDYCMARKLDPMKKPCHIVPMEVSVKNQETGAVAKVWRDVVMPGIYEYRTTAMRTGLYMGHSTPEYGPEISVHGTTAPEWCSMVFYRWNEKANQRVEFPVVVYFEEICATKWDNNAGTYVANARWKKAGIQMLTKCTEAAGLREAFPDELGGEHTMEELEGRLLGDDDRVIATVQSANRTATAKEALQQRFAGSAQQGQQAASHGQPNAGQAPAQQPAQKNAQPVDNVPRVPPLAQSEPLPWESIRGPSDIPGWKQAFNACNSIDKVQELWDHCVDMHDAAQLEIPIDIEATMDLMREKFTEGKT